MCCTKQWVPSGRSSNSTYALVQDVSKSRKDIAPTPIFSLGIVAESIAHNLAIIVR
jgi:hypothetical protein